jgi:hypothetical protein
MDLVVHFIGGILSITKSEVCGIYVKLEWVWKSENESKYM